MRKATFAELKSGSEWFIAICVSRSKSLLELYIGYSLRLNCTQLYNISDYKTFLQDDRLKTTYNIKTCNNTHTKARTTISHTKVFNITADIED